MTPLVFKSSMPKAAWRGDLTIYRSQYETRPTAEHKNLTVDALYELMAPASGPCLTEEKAKATYATPGLLRDAPYVGRTLEKAVEAKQPTSGKQRSSQHVTEATFLVFDIDDTSTDQITAMGRAIRGDGISALMYTTYSHGAADKPGCRIRAVIPVDGPMDSALYCRAWAGANQRWFLEMADSTGSKLSQAQGLWATHPERANKASRRVIEGGIASLEALLAISPVAVTPPTQSLRRAVTGSLNPADCALQIEQITRALPLVDADDYSPWVRNIVCLKALAPELGEDDMRALAVTYSQQGSSNSTQRNGDPRYDPEQVFDSTRADMSPDAARGTLFGQASAEASKIFAGYLAAVQQGVPTKNDEQVKLAVGYLSRYHPKKYEQIKRGEV